MMIKHFFSNIYQEIKYFYLNREEKALTYTLLLMLLLLSSLVVFQIGTPLEREIAFEIDPDMLPSEQAIAELTPQPPSPDALLTTQAYNTADLSLTHVEKFQSLEEILQEQQAAEQAFSELSPAPAVAYPPVESTDAPSAAVAPVEPKAAAQVNKNALVTYFLEGRDAVGALPNPIYTCEQEGQIVIDIVVDASGRVIKTAFNKELSSSKHPCLVENALTYAERAIFSPSAQPKQNGIITYSYQPK